MSKKEIPHGFIENNQLFRTGLSGSAPILLKTVTEENEAETIAYYQERYSKLLSKFTELENRILGTENKGSFLAKIHNLTETIASHDGLGDYDLIATKLAQYENQIQDIIASNRKRNTDIKNALLLELEEALQNNDFHEVGQAIKDIKTRWIKTGNADSKINADLEDRFTTLTQTFYDKRQAFFEDKKKLTASRIEKYDHVINELVAIAKDGNVLKAADKVKELQETWKNIGHIPEAEYKPRNTQYWELCKLFYQELSAEKKKNKPKEDIKTNLKLKKAIVDQLHELEKKALHEEVKPAVEESKKVWKSIGRVPKSEVEPLNKAFLHALDLISEKAFIFQLASRKFKGFAKKSTEERNKILIKLVRELLTRDKNELTVFQQNMDNMHVNKGTFVDMLEKKLKNQQDRVEAKKLILKELQANQPVHKKAPPAGNKNVG